MRIIPDVVDGKGVASWPQCSGRKDLRCPAAAVRSRSAAWVTRASASCHRSDARPARGPAERDNVPNPARRFSSSAPSSAPPADGQHGGDRRGGPGSATPIGVLPAEALAVQAALAGDHRVGAGQRASSPTSSRTTSMPGLRVARRARPGPRSPTPPAAPAPGASAWAADRFRVAAPAEHAGQVGSGPRRGVRHPAGSRPSADRIPPPPRRAPSSGLVHVGRQHHRAFGEPRVEPGQVHADQVAQGPAAIAAGRLRRRRPAGGRPAPGACPLRRRCWRCRRRRARCPGTRRPARRRSAHRCPAGCAARPSGRCRRPAREHAQPGRGGHLDDRGSLRREPDGARNGLPGGARDRRRSAGTKPASRAASTVPSPPSATGTTRCAARESCGPDRRRRRGHLRPRSEPLNLSEAMTTRMIGGFLQAEMRAVLPASLSIGTRALGASSAAAASVLELVHRVQPGAPMAMFVTFSKITSTTTGTWNSSTGDRPRRSRSAARSDPRRASPCSPGPRPPSRGPRRSPCSSGELMLSKPSDTW